MAQDALFCGNIGNTTDQLACCFPEDQDSKVCRGNFNWDVRPFSGGCPSGDCLKDCSNVTTIYESLAQDDPSLGNGKAPIRRYQTCANVPSVAGYLSQGILDKNITSIIGDNVSAKATPDQLKRVTSAVTECLTSTCMNARNNKDCQSKCSPVNILINNTTPDVQGLNGCLNSLCVGGYNSLPFADPDIVGIGVFASYIMQCMLVVILWSGLSAFRIHKFRRQKKLVRQQKLKPQRESLIDKAETETTEPSQCRSCNKSPNHQELFERCIVDFHKTQCFFSATIQIASLSYGIFDTNMLITFMLTPLATNGVLPVIFGYFLLYRCGKATGYITVLTAVCWLLSSIVYWALYSSVIPINNEITSEKARYRAYQQFMYKLSALDACGGYSALAVCPHNFDIGKHELFKASHNIRILTPIIWSFATVCLIVMLAFKTAGWIAAYLAHRIRKAHADASSPPHDRRNETENSSLPSIKGYSVAYWMASACFLAGVGMQLSLLSIGTSLKMMDRNMWGFGQIIAVTIWVSPLMDYVYSAVRKLLGKEDKSNTEVKSLTSH